MIQYVSEGAAHAVLTLVAGYAAPALAGACAASSRAPAVPIPHIQEEIVPEETTEDFVPTPVFAGDTSFDTRWERQGEVLRVGDRHHEGQLRVVCW